MEDPLEEKQNLKSIYNTIADVWVHLKAKPLEEVVEFCNSIEKKGLVLDIGCSNCRNLIPFLERKFSCIALDFSKNMIRKAKEFLLKRKLSANFIIADINNLPFRNNVFDYVLCTRVLHHLPTRALRSGALAEIKRIVKDKGEILMSVYRRYFPRFFADIFSNLFEKKFEFGDTYKRWSYHGKVYKRFYHLFTIEEFEKELKNSGFGVKSIFKNKENVIGKCSIPLG